MSYAEARAAFLAAARAAGARLESIAAPAGLRGAEGEALAIDIAHLGPAHGGTALITISGLHGVEGFCGSAVQRRWLENGRPAIHIHAANPWGFSHRSRCDEANVDLNRNLIEDFSAPPRNAAYRLIHPILAAPAFTDAAFAAQDAALEDFAAAHGAQALTDAMIGGQYEIAEGLNYGGAAPAWPLRAIAALVDHAARAHERLLLIDLHTGIAPRGDVAVLPFAGDCAPLCADPRFALGAPGLAAMTGVLVAGLARRLPCPVTAAVVEFGTTDRAEIRRALRLDLALRLAPPEDAALAAALRARVVEAFWPSDPAWQANLPALADALIRAAGAMR